MEIWFKVLEKSWNSIGQHAYEPWKQDEIFPLSENLVPPNVNFCEAN